MHDFEIQTVNNKNFLFVMAVAMEYRQALRQRIRPLLCGVGPVEAAINLTRALCHATHLPDFIVSLGSAGSARLKQGEVYQVKTVSYRDMDASALGFTKGVTPFIDHEVAIPLPCPLDHVPTASLSTGGNIVSGGVYETIEADMVDMESFALKRVADLFEIPMIGLRGISDGHGELSQYKDWTALLEVIDQKLAKCVDSIFKQI